MGIHPQCVFNDGKNNSGYYRDKNSGLVVCTRHKLQYDEREDDLGPFDWEWINWSNILTDN